MDTGNLIQHQFLEVKSKYPKLSSPVHEGKMWRISGHIDVIDDEGGYWDTYDVTILLFNDYPESLPILIETGKKIQRHVDWHISKEGICCLSTPAKMYHDLAGNITLLRWLNMFAHPYLANHVYKIKTGGYAGSEFSHGNKGIVEGWKLILGTSDSKQLLWHLEHLVWIKQSALNRPCFCGSGKKYKRCFLLNIEEHRSGIPYHQIMEDVKSLKQNRFR
jgi:hypothetical protein